MSGMRMDVGLEISFLEVVDLEAARRTCTLPQALYYHTVKTVDAVHLYVHHAQVAWLCRFGNFFHFKHYGLRRLSLCGDKR